MIIILCVWYTNAIIIVIIVLRGQINSKLLLIPNKQNNWSPNAIYIPNIILCIVSMIYIFHFQCLSVDISANIR